MCVPPVTVVISTCLQDRPTVLIGSARTGAIPASTRRGAASSAIKVPSSLRTAGARACVLVNSKPTFDSLIVA